LVKGVDMTREETVGLIRSIMSLYPNWKPDNLTDTVNAWAWALEEYPAKAVKSALQIYIKTNNTGFAPSVSQIINAIYKPSESSILSEGEAWSMVKRAIQDGAYSSVERFNELPELVQKAVGDSNMIYQWSQTDSDTVNTVIMSNFQRTYRAIVQRAKEDARINPIIVDLARTIGEKQQNLIEQGDKNGA